LNNLKINKTNLENITKQYKDKTEFCIMQDEIKNEILKETIEQINNYSTSIKAKEDDFELSFPDFTGDNVHKKISANQSIVFYIKPANSFKAKGNLVDVFKSKYNNNKNLALFEPNIKLISQITHGHEGEEFVVVRPKLEEEVRRQLILQNYESDEKSVRIRFTPPKSTKMKKGDEVHIIISAAHGSELFGTKDIKFSFDTLY